MSFNVDRVFDTIIEGGSPDSHQTFKSSLRHTAPAKNASSKRANKDVEYVSPFRTSLSSGQMHNSSRLRDARYPVSNPRSTYNRTTPVQLGYRNDASLMQDGNTQFARDIALPKELSLNEQRQMRELRAIQEKENNLKQIKQSQRIFTLDASELDDNKIVDDAETHSINVAAAPRVPSHFFLDESTQRSSGKTSTTRNNPKKKTVGKARVPKQNPPASGVVSSSTPVYPVATPSNPEEIVHLRKGNHVSYHTKAVFDSVNHGRQKHQAYLRDLQENQTKRYNSKLAEYEEQISQEQSKIDALRNELVKLEQEQKNTLEAEEQAVVRRYLQNISTYSKRKQDAVREVNATKLASEKAQKEEEEYNKAQLLQKQQDEEQRKKKEEEKVREEAALIERFERLGESSDEDQSEEQSQRLVTEYHEAVFRQFDSPGVVAVNTNDSNYQRGEESHDEYNSNIGEANNDHIAHTDGAHEDEVFNATHASPLQPEVIPAEENTGNEDAAEATPRASTSPNSFTITQSGTDIRIYGNMSGFSEREIPRKVNDTSLTAEQEYESIKESALKRLNEVQNSSNGDIYEASNSPAVGAYQQEQSNGNSLVNPSSVPATHFQSLEGVI